MAFGDNLRPLVDSSQIKGKTKQWSCIWLSDNFLSLVK